MLKSRQGEACKTCNQLVPPDKKLQHEKSDYHNVAIMKHMMQTREPEFLKDKEGIHLVCTNTNETGSVFKIPCIMAEFKEIEIEVFSDDFDVKLRKTLVIIGKNVMEFLNPVEAGAVTIKKGSSYKLKLQAYSDQQFSSPLPIGLLFSRQGNNHIFIMRYVRVTFEDPTVKSLEPEAPYVPVEPVAQLPPAERVVPIKMSRTKAYQKVAEERIARCPDNFVPGSDEYAEEILVNTEAVRKVPLHMYYPPSVLKFIHMNALNETPDMTEDVKKFLAEVKESLAIGIDSENPKNYGKLFTTLLSFEDIQQETDIRMYDKERAELKPFEDDPERFEIEMADLEEGRPSLLKFDKICVRQEDKLIEYEGFIDKIKAKSIEVVMGPEFVKEFYESADYADDSDEEMEFDLARPSTVRYGVRFTVGRKVMRLMYRALNQYADCLDKELPIDQLLMPRVQWPADPTTSSLDIKLVNKNIETNPEQLCAVRNIVLGLHRPLAYVLFGPPGTGKTTTITEAIIQVYRILPESRILIVAPSNSAVNVVTEKILNSNAVPRGEIFRLVGVNSTEQRVSEEVRNVSNWKKMLGQFQEVDCETIKKYRIVACTLSMSGVIVTMGVQRDHFTHIFIDEAGHAMEPEALIPLAGLLEPIQGSVILSGDHLQLGPIIRSPIARSNKMVKSLLERIMEEIPYRRKANNAYNPMVLTKLVKNFRSHEKILNVPNELFYDSELEACGSKDVTHSMVTYEKLPARGIPIIFHGVHGRELRESNNPSFFNPEEISVIVGYVRHLLSENTKTFTEESIKPSDIGIIAPYRKQVLKLRQFLQQHKLDEVTVGSTEEFQGQERLIMIISTVRCSKSVFDNNPGQSLGFLKNRKRFNVAVTRAKALMIIVGDPRILSRDYCWNRLLQTCNDEGCAAGETYEPNARQYHDLKEKLEELELNLQSKLASGGQMTITDMALQEEPQWKEEE